MATRQYIGARYVIKIYENTQDPSSAEWQSGTSYEPLTMVTYQNSSYLSRKAVPSTVGNPASNPSYWAITGAYNGQIANLQNQIDNINNNVIPPIEEELNRMLNKKIVWIGDSYMECNYGSLTPSQSFARQASSNLGLQENVDYFISAVSGYGFSKSGYKFITLLQNISLPIADTEITDVIVCGGANDTGYINDIYNDILSFDTACKTRFPNAKLHLAFTDWFMGSGNTYGLMIKEWKRACNKRGINFVEDIWMCQHSWSLKVSDGHPNLDGQTMIAQGLVDYLLTGCVSKPQLGYVPVTLIPQSGVTISGGTNTFSCLDGDIASIEFEWTMFTFDTAIACTAGSPSGIGVCTFITGTVGGSEYSNVAYPITFIGYDDSNVVHPMMGIAIIHKGLLKIYPFVSTNMNLKKIYLPPTTIQNGYTNI